MISVDLGDLPERVLFIISPAGRCGTNFLAGALAELGCAEATPIPEDYLVYHSHQLLNYADRLADTWSKWLDDDEIRRERETLLRSIGGGLLHSFAERTAAGSWTVLKTPSSRHLRNFPLLFGRAKLILLVRDGRDVVESSVAAWPGHSVEYWRDAWIRGGRRVIDFIAQNSALDSRMWLLVRYEDLVRTPLEAFARILAFLGIDSRSVDLTRLNAVPVWGSSFLGHTSGKWEWGVAAREQGFRPIGRWRSWPVDRQRDFIANAGSELRAFGYETSGLGPESGEGGTG